MQNFRPTGPEWFEHQKSHFLEHAEDRAWGLLWEQGTAKTKPVIDTVVHLCNAGKINGLLVVAPPGVERNWANEELPVHAPPEFLEKSKLMVWHSAKASTKKHQAQFEILLKHDNFIILMMSYHAFMTQKGKNAVWRFLKKREAMYILDESHNIKSPAAKRTKSIVASGKYAKYRRILTGTPISQGPFDIYSQIRFLDENFWKKLHINNFYAFKQHFGVWLDRAEFQKQSGFDIGYDKLLGYKNIDKLKESISEITDRVVKDDVLDLPPKLYAKRYFEISPQQQKIYYQLRDDYMSDLNGEIIDGELAIVRLLRMQQVLCGYVTTENEEEPTQLIGPKNPRIECLREITDQTVGSGIIWAKFRKDVDQIMDLLGEDAVRYDGTVDEEQSEINKKRFQNDEVKWFVGTASKGGPGLTLHKAKTVIYYSNSFKLIDRLQSEDRAHRAGMDGNPVMYYDICCPGTVDDHIILNLRNKVDVASQVTGDSLKEWI